MFVHHTNKEDAQAEARRLVCYDCGVACDMSSMREERIEFLDHLGAEKPRLPVIRTEEQRDADMDRRPMRKVDQGEAVTIRIGFAKLGRVAYTSHLDLVRLFPRWFRRAQLPLFWSEGFHPKPKMTFTPALGLGMPSLAEYVDVKLIRTDDTERYGISARLMALGQAVSESFELATAARSIVRELRDALGHAVAISQPATMPRSSVDHGPASMASREIARAAAVMSGVSRTSKAMPAP